MTKTIINYTHLCPACFEMDYRIYCSNEMIDRSILYHQINWESLKNEYSLFWRLSNHHIFQCQECQSQIPIHRNNQVKFHIKRFCSQHWELGHKGWYMQNNKTSMSGKNLVLSKPRTKESKAKLQAKIHKVIDIHTREILDAEDQ